MKLFSKPNGSRGMVLAITMMTIVLMALLAIAALEMGQGQYKQTAAISADRYKALMAAEFGMREAFWRIQNNAWSDAPPLGPVDNTPAPNNYFANPLWAPYDFYFDIDDFTSNASIIGPATISAGDDVKISISAVDATPGSANFGHRRVTCTGVVRNP